MDRIESPCVRNCSLDKDDICIGCSRSLEEIMGWGEASEDSKKETIERIKSRQKESHHS